MAHGWSEMMPACSLVSVTFLSFYLSLSHGALPELLLLNPSEYIWRDACGQRPVDRNGWWSFYSSELRCPGGAPVSVPCHGVCRAAAAGPAGETTAAAEAAAAGERPSHTHSRTDFPLVFGEALVVQLKWANTKSNSRTKSFDTVKC